LLQTKENYAMSLFTIIMGSILVNDNGWSFKIKSTWTLENFA